MFASQLAAVPHAHGATSLEEQQNHDATPHFHWFGHCQHCHSDSHSHSHAHGEHGHHHHESPSEHEDSDRQTPCPAGKAVDHDADAIYLVGGGTHSTLGSISQVPSTQVLLFALQTPVATSICGIEAKEVRGLPWRPPDQVLDGSEIYLTLRTLRI
ncbi:hypothetical protein NA78x_002752 [Anatilimnocola sp. NA78]|uniref:hypothetical protein n=1 Tax=Anatilimnocola sp. NA78 TaxID=3415683 RepID=UPI003CE480BA